MDMIVRNCISHRGVGELSRYLARWCPWYARAIHIGGQAGIGMRWRAAIYPNESET